VRKEKKKILKGRLFKLQEREKCSKEKFGEGTDKNVYEVNEIIERKLILSGGKKTTTKGQEQEQEEREEYNNGKVQYFIQAKKIHATACFGAYMMMRRKIMLAIAKKKRRDILKENPDFLSSSGI
jgi:hypothetical protein